MVDNATAVAQQPKFTEIRYKTKDGENCSATKKDGIVTIQGDKNGVRQMTLEQFVQEEMQKIVPPDLEKTPKKDTVSFSGGEKSEDSSEEEKKSSHTGLYATLAGMALVTTAAILAHKGVLGKSAKSFMNDKIVQPVKDFCSGLRKEMPKANAEDANPESSAEVSA